MRHGYQPSWEKMAVAIESCFPENLEQANSLRNEYLPDVKSKYSITQKNCKQNLLILDILIYNFHVLLTKDMHPS